MAIESEDIEELALAPQTVRTEEGTVVERPIDDVIKADQYAATKSAATAVPWGMRAARMKPGGTTPGRCS